MAKIRDLGDARVAEVEDFVDFLRTRDEQRELVEAAEGLSESSLASVWDNPDDDVYNGEQSETGTASAGGIAQDRCSHDWSLSHMRQFIDEAEMSMQKLAGVARLNLIYEQYVKPVEQDHQGEYVLVKPDGEMIFATSMPELFDKTDGMDDWDNCIFKVGEISAANIL